MLDSPGSTGSITPSRLARSEAPDVLADIYRADCQLAIWQRQLSAPLRQSLNQLLAPGCRINITEEITLADCAAQLACALGAHPASLALRDDIALLIDMFACLFDTDRVGLRLRTLNGAMCPAFHIDKVPCRLITTYLGPGTEWIAGADDNASAEQLLEQLRAEPELFQSRIQALETGDVALLKGSAWPQQADLAVIHRSPSPNLPAARLLLTLDAF